MEIPGFNVTQELNIGMCSWDYGEKSESSKSRKFDAGLRLCKMGGFSLWIIGFLENSYRLEYKF